MTRASELLGKICEDESGRFYDEAKSWLEQIHQKLEDVQRMTIKYDSALEKGSIDNLEPTEVKLQNEIYAMLKKIGGIV